MTLKVLDLAQDDVIRSLSINVKTDYHYATTSIIPLIDRLDIQRSTLKPHFYTKLGNDILRGCIMPPLTLAVVDNDHNITTTADAERYILENINEAFVLDGIQRLNTLRKLDLSSEQLSRPLYINILICDSKDKLLYRMITLNNGQRPMSARHQVEILLGNIYDFDNLSITVKTEKEQQKKRIRGAFKKDVIIKAYLAFIGHSINIDNNKIIESKLDELIVDNIIESDLTERLFEFSDVIDIVGKHCEATTIRKWFETQNNLIGFSAGISVSYEQMKNISSEEFEEAIDLFERAFEYLDVSKIKLGMARRKAVQHYIENFNDLRILSENKLINEISQKI